MILFAVAPASLAHIMLARQAEQAPFGPQEPLDDVMKQAPAPPKKQLLHFVFGGELKDLNQMEFKDLRQIDIVGLFPDHASAVAAWRAKAQASVDNAQMRYFVAHLHRLLDPEQHEEEGDHDH
jgi:Domain of unknown function (DUF4170)